MNIKMTVSKPTIVGLIMIALTTLNTLQAVSVPAESPAEAKLASLAQVASGDSVEAKKEIVASEVKKDTVPESSQVEPKTGSSDKLADDRKRKGRAEQVSDEKSALGASKQLAESSASSPSITTTTSSPGQENKDKSLSDKSTKAAETKAGPKPSKSPLTGKSGSQKSKLPANLGTVTSTGSGGPTHYLSKHDAYSAIAEKHGSVAHDAARKADKRNLQRFGGIQKASGFGDVLSPFKGVTDSGLARTLGASMRSIIKGKFSVPAYVASALLGAVALMAFYESPISPLPVPPLPEPPVGRFPPEMPVISPNAQVPFRGNQQLQYGQNYNARSSMVPQQAYGSLNQQQPQHQQVLFPDNQAMAQQTASASSSVQQIAANLLPVKQTAQRKSGPDFDQSTSRSLFGANPTKPSIPVNQQLKQGSFLSFLGLGAGSSVSPASPAPGPVTSPVDSLAPASVQQASGLQSASSFEPKGSLASGNATPMSNLHLVNKVKSFFSRSPATAVSGSSLSNSNNPDYQRMSFVQAFMKDAAFLPAFLSPNRKSSSPAISAGNKIQSMASALASSAPVGASSRMQVASEGQLAPTVTNQLKRQSVPPTSGYGLVKAADRIAHALLETFSSNISQRSAGSSSQSAGRELSNSDGQSAGIQSPLASATSLLTDIMSTYSSNVANNPSEPQQVGHDQQKPVSQQSQSQAAPEVQVTGSGAESVSTEDKKQQVAVQPQNQNKQTAALPGESPQSALSRKTRSIGFEYPIESNPMLVQRDQQPSRAAQINNVIDYVADSYVQNKLLFNFVMNQVGLSQAVPYVEQILASNANEIRL